MKTQNRIRTPGTGPERVPEARTTRRNPGWAAVVAVMAVLVVVVTAFALGRVNRNENAGPGSTTSVSPVPPATSATSPSSTTSSSSTSTTHQPPAGVLNVTALTAGPSPAIAYLARGVVHLPDGTSVTPDTRFRPVGFTRLADGTVAYLTQHGSVMGVEIVTPDGDHHGPYRSGYELVVNTDRSVVAWLSGQRAPTVWQSGQTEPVTFPVAIPGNSRRLAAVVGNDCMTPTGCRVYASSWTTSGPMAWVATPDGTLARADAFGRLVAVRDATESGRLVGYLRITDTGSTSGVIAESTTGHPLMWQTSRHTLDTFSPDLRYLLAGPAYRDGIGDSQVAIYSGVGQLLAHRQILGELPGFVSGATWEDSTHVLFTVHQAGHWSIVRMGVDGRLEYAVWPQAGRWDRAPFQLEITP